MTLQNRTCIVTGGASGIGRASAIALAADGGQVVVSDVDDAGGAQTLSLIEQAGGTAIYVHCDVSDADQARHLVQAAVDEYERVDVLFNNAGINAMEGNVVDLDLAIWTKTFGVNVDGILYCSRFAIPEMRKVGGGRIINTASPASFRGWPSNSAYIASKGAVMSLTRAMAMDFVSDNIRVNALVPGLIMTGIGRDFLNAQADPDAVASGNPIGRPGQPEEVAPMVVFLAQEECTFSTGAPFYVDGGELAGSA